jgi:hypothetical protein
MTPAYNPRFRVTTYYANPETRSNLPAKRPPFRLLSHTAMSLAQIFLETITLRQCREIGNLLSGVQEGLFETLVNAMKSGNDGHDASR